MSGNEAVVAGAMAAGCNFFAGYPITPSSEILEGLSREMPKRNAKLVQMEDEIGSIAAVVGASLAGAKALTATSGPGFSLKVENIGFGAMVEAPCVVVNVMRGGPSTGLPTHSSQADVLQAAWGPHGDRPNIALSPATAREAFDLTIKAFNLAEQYRTPVVLLLDEVVGHGSERVEIPHIDPGMLVERKKPTGPKEDYLPYIHTDDGIPPMAPYGSGRRWHATGLSHDETGFPTADPEEIEKLHRRLLRKVAAVEDKIYDWDEFGDEHPETIFVAYGSTSRSVRSAMRSLRDQGHRCRLFRPKIIWPFFYPVLHKAAEDPNTKRFVVVEMNAGQMAGEVERAVCGKADVHRVGRLNGEILAPNEIEASFLEIIRDV
jgi:2-oxoglutarate ferredoxin oxidoreductase subunit alpha